MTWEVDVIEQPIRFSRAAALCIVNAVLWGCADPPPDDGARNAAPAAKAMAVLPGALQLPITSYNSKQLHDFVAQLDSVVGPDQPRCSQADPPCAPMTSAQIVTFVGQSLVGPANVAGYGNGTIVMRIRNTGAVGGPDERRYAMKPGQHRYYMLALPDGPDRMRWELWGIPSANAAVAPTRIKQGVWQLCGHPPQNTVDGKFGTCENVELQKAGTRTADPDDPAWMTCSAGCCTANEQ